AVLDGGDLQATKDAGPVPLIRTFDSDTEEAHGIARAAKRAHGNGARWSDIAVLVRTNAQKAALETAFRAANVPCRSDFLQLPEIRDALQRGASSFTAWRRDLEDDVHSLDEGNERRQSLDVLLGYAADFAAIDPAPTVAAFTTSL